MLARLRALSAAGKPVATTEFGCPTCRGASGPGSLALLDLFRAEGIDTTLVNTFARYDLPHRSGPREDLGLASHGIVKVLEDRRDVTYPDMPWEPKAAFRALAAR